MGFDFKLVSQDAPYVGTYIVHLIAPNIMMTDIELSEVLICIIASIWHKVNLLLLIIPPIGGCCGVSSGCV